MIDLKPTLAKLADGASLSEADAESAFEAIMSGQTTPAQIAAFLMALRVRGETVAELTGAARIMRAKALRVKAPADAIDTVGTGGEASGSYNISTATAFVLAGCGVNVAKHGNRAVSSKTGAADVLAALGVNLDAAPELIELAIQRAKIGFLFAQKHHSAMKHVAPVRAELGLRTIFNLVGPLSNPAGAKRQLLGVFAHKWIVPMAETLGRLGSERAWVVHGSDGLDEITTTGASFVAELKDGQVRAFEVTPEDAGLPRAEPAALKGGDAQHNAQALLRVLAGEKSAYRDIVLLNAAAALIVAGKAADLKAGASLAAQAIASGHAAKALESLVAITNGHSP
ncbi:MAG: anthranilate phosphoribosyltransferase [Rhodospirillaceae bacterium]|nr:anthranilate phosphoribosyltransferase [Rhodospirillaceae bacterium]